MRLPLTITICLLLTLSAAGQAPTPTPLPGERLAVDYDKFKDLTVIQSPSMLVFPSQKGSGPIVELQASCGFTGREPKKGAVVLIFSFYSKSRDWSFLNSHAGIALADDARIKLGEGDRRGSVIAGSIVRETINFDVTLDTMAKLGTAENFEVQVGSFEGVVEKWDRTTIPDLLKACTPK